MKLTTKRNGISSFDCVKNCCDKPAPEQTGNSKRSGTKRELKLEQTAHIRCSTEIKESILYIRYMKLPNSRGNSVSHIVV